jgi:hypothetical protein
MIFGRMRRASNKSTEEVPGLELKRKEERLLRTFGKIAIEVAMTCQAEVMLTRRDVRF